MELYLTYKRLFLRTLLRVSPQFQREMSTEWR